jgi:hypothetical protein
VSEAGVLLGEVTQVRSKGAAKYVGVSVGMHSLIRSVHLTLWACVLGINVVVAAAPPLLPSLVTEVPCLSLCPA